VKRIASTLIVLGLGAAGGVVVGASAAPSHTSPVTVAGGVTTVKATPHTVTRYVVHTRTVAAPVPAEPAPSTPASSVDCNDLPASASKDLTEIRESRCEIEKLEAESPSASTEHEIETLISDERSIEASE
jgi:hypothetical protein